MKLVICRPAGGPRVRVADLVEVADIGGQLLDLETRIQLWPEQWPHARIVRAIRLIRHDQPWLEASREEPAR